MVENPKKGKKNQPDEKPCIFRLKKHIASHELSEEQAKTLITAKRVGPIESFKSRFGKPFSADLTIARQKRSWKVEFIFEGDDLREEELKNLTDDQIICEAPSGDEKSDAKIKVYETERAYLAPDMAKKVDDRGVRISKTILQKEIPQDQAIKLFAEGKTDLMPGFISSKKGRKFSAHLKLNYTTGKLEFEFAPRKKKKKKGEEEEGDGKVRVIKKKKAPKKKKATKKKKSSKKKKAAKKKAAKKKKTDAKKPDSDAAE